MKEIKQKEFTIVRQKQIILNLKEKLTKRNISNRKYVDRLIKRAVKEKYGDVMKKLEEDTRKNMIEKVEEAEIIWKEYALEDDSKLTKDAIELKRKLLKNPYLELAKKLKEGLG